MSADQFKIITEGKLLSGHNLPNVQLTIARLFKQPVEKILPLLSGNPVTIKTGLNHAQALQYLEAMEKAGLQAKMIPLSAPQQPDLPAPKKNTKTTTAKPFINEVLAQFKGDIAPVKTSLGYKISISAAALILLLIPLFYFALFVLTGYGVYYHATEHLSLFHGRGSVWRLVVYAIPLVAGPLLMLVMVKPILATFTHAPRLVELNANTQPHIFAFVHRICDAVNAPYPSVIRLDCEVNASASFRHGFTSFFSNELVLTLGMPLLAGLTLRTLAGIIAHEFGHFSQGAAMRMTYIIYTVLHWLRVAVYHEDAIDHKLQKIAASEITFINTIAVASHWIIFLVRKLFYYMLRFGEFVAQMLSRQMEFDADRYAARLIGSAHYQDISLNVTRLVLAARSVNQQLQESWHNNQLLVEDYPGAIAVEYQQQDAEITKEVLKTIAEGDTHWQDTHPCDRERITNALKEQSPGIFTLDTPASKLITRFDKLSKDISFTHFRTVWELPVAHQQLISVDKFIGKGKQRRAGFEALNRYFCESYNVFTPVVIALAAPGDAVTVAELRNQWNSLTQSIDTPQHTEQLNTQYTKLHERLDLAVRADALLKAGFSIDPKEFNVPNANPKSVENWVTTSTDQFKQCLDKIIDYNTKIIQRLSITLSLGHSPALRGVLDATETDLLDLPTTLQCLQRINSVLTDTRLLTFNQSRLDVLFYNWDTNTEPTKTFMDEIEKIKNVCKRHLQAIHNVLATCPYPLKHMKKGYQLGEHLFGNVSLAEFNPAQIAQLGQQVMENLFYLQWQIMGNLITLAVAIEQAASLSPIHLGPVLPQQRER